MLADLRLWWAGSPGFWGVTSSAAAYSHWNTSIYDAIILPEGEEMMSNVNIVYLWEEGKPTRIASEASVRRRLDGSLVCDSSR